MSKKVWLFIVLSSLGVSVIGDPARAIPPFARRYGVSCATCHTVWPQLNSFGNAFLADGFRMPGETDPKTDIGSMIGLAVETWMVSEEETRGSDFQLHKIELLAGGALSGKASVFVEAYVEERGAPHEAGDVFIRQDDVLKLGRIPLSIRAGQFQPSLLNPDGQRISVTRNQVYDSKINGWRLRSPQRGIELFAYGEDESYYGISLVNGNGNPAEKNNLSDSNNHKDIGLSINQVLPGHWLGGSNSLGIYAYTGRITSPLASGSTYDDKFNRLMLQFDHTRLKGNHKLFGGFMTGKHDNPNGEGISQDCRGMFIEGNYFLNPSTAAFARWDSFDPDTSKSGDTTREFCLGMARVSGLYTKLTGQYRFRDGGNDQLLIEVEADF